MLPTRREVRQYVRSLAPSDNSHWLLLAGSTFLFVARGGAWWPTGSSRNPELMVWGGFVTMFCLPLLVAGSAGYHVALFRCKSPAKRLLCWALIPSSAALLAIIVTACFELPLGGPLSQSILASADNSDLVHLRAVLMSLARSGGFQISIAGVGLIAVFYVLLRLNRTTLPTSVVATDPASADEQHKTLRFVWIMICLVFLVSLLTGMLLAPVQIFSISRHIRLRGVFWVSDIVYLVLLLGLVLFAIGEDGRGELRSYLRLPDAEHSLLAIFYPAAIASVLPLLGYIHDRILWASYQWGRLYAPTLDHYFQTPSLSWFLYFPSVFVEEIAWRGYLQPRFIRRYGVIRGVFFVGIVWGAFHFSSDFFTVGFYGRGFQAVLIRLMSRLAAMVAISYPLAWLTIRSKSILPATITHGLYDALLALPAESLQDLWWIQIPLWAILGYVLFRSYAPGPEQRVEDIARSEQPAPET